MPLIAVQKSTGNAPLAQTRRNGRPAPRERVEAEIEPKTGWIEISPSERRSRTGDDRARRVDIARQIFGTPVDAKFAELNLRDILD
jgi:hypothetical protein